VLAEEDTLRVPHLRTDQCAMQEEQRRPRTSDVVLQVHAWISNNNFNFSVLSKKRTFNQQ
jgi:hypothetical protein